jgi:putative hydrolase of the HAD superfamily
VLSCEVGLKKPDPAIYLLACERLGVQPAECAFVGDGGSHELDAAHSLGMLTLHLDRPEHATDLAGLQPSHYRLAALHQVVDVLPG